MQAETVRHKWPVEKSKANHPFLAKWESKIKSSVLSLEAGFLHQHRSTQNKQCFYMWVADGFPEGSQPGTDVLRREGGSGGGWSIPSSHQHPCCILHSPLSCTELWPFNHTARPVSPCPLSAIHRHSWICPQRGELDSSRLIRTFNVEQQNYFVRRMKHRQIHW